jgi:hypothetical protein
MLSKESWKSVPIGFLRRTLVHWVGSSKDTFCDVSVYWLQVNETSLTMASAMRPNSLILRGRCKAFYYSVLKITLLQCERKNVIISLILLPTEYVTVSINAPRQRIVTCGRQYVGLCAEQDF